GVDRARTRDLGVAPDPATRPATPADVVATVRGLGKCYHLYRKPADRLRQFLFGRRRRFYRAVWALRGVDLEVRRGETLGIVGANGAGKSTLLQMLAGTLTPTEGTVETDGRITALLELGSGFYGEYTGRENAVLAGTILGMDRAAVEQRLASILEFADIGEFVDRPVKTYSRGMFARLAFAVYAHLDPELFIVDEALAVGDAPFRHRCMYRFRHMKETGVSIVYVSHDAASMKHLCDRVAWIHRGRLQAIGPPSEVVDAYLEEAFGITETPPPDAPVRRPRAGDARSGTGACRITDFRLTVDGQPVTHVDVPATVELRWTMHNATLDPAHDRLQTGWTLTNVRGLAI